MGIVSDEVVVRVDICLAFRPVRFVPGSKVFAVAGAQAELGLFLTGCWRQREDAQKATFDFIARGADPRVIEIEVGDRELQEDCETGRWLYFHELKAQLGRADAHLYREAMPEMRGADAVGLVVGVLDNLVLRGELFATEEVGQQIVREMAWRGMKPTVVELPVVAPLHTGRDQ